MLPILGQFAELPLVQGLRENVFFLQNMHMYISQTGYLLNFYFLCILKCI